MPAGKKIQKAGLVMQPNYWARLYTSAIEHNKEVGNDTRIVVLVCPVCTQELFIEIEVSDGFFNDVITCGSCRKSAEGVINCGLLETDHPYWRHEQTILGDDTGAGDGTNAGRPQNASVPDFDNEG